MAENFPCCPSQVNNILPGAFYNPNSCPHGVRRSLHASDTLICMRVPFSDQLCVVKFNLLLNSFNRLEVFDGLDMKFSGCIFIHDD